MLYFNSKIFELNNKLDGKIWTSQDNTHIRFSYGTWIFKTSYDLYFQDEYFSLICLDPKKYYYFRYTGKHYLGNKPTKQVLKIVSVVTSCLNTNSLKFVLEN